MESTNLTLEELEFIIFAMSKTPLVERSDKFQKLYSKILLLILEKLEEDQVKVRRCHKMTTVYQNTIL